MFFDRHLFILLVSIASSTIHGMKKEEIHCNLYLPIDFLPAALMEGNVKKLKAVIANPNIRPNTTINTEIGCLDLFTYLVLQQLPDKTTYECANILCQAGFFITLPSKTDYFTVFHFVKSKNMLDYFIKTAKVTDPKDLLNRCYPKEKRTLFEKLFIELIPTCELKAIYSAYKPTLYHKKSANNTILHELLGFFLFHTLNAQPFYLLSVQRIRSMFSENAFQCVTTYNYIDETYNKFKFIVENGDINPLEKNKYNQTPYDFYIFLLNGLQKNDPSLCVSQCPEHIQLITTLFNLKNMFEGRNINMKRFFDESFALAELIVPLYKSKIIR